MLHMINMYNYDSITYLIKSFEEITEQLSHDDKLYKLQHNRR